MGLFSKKNRDAAPADEPARRQDGLAAQPDRDDKLREPEEESGEVLLIVTEAYLLTDGNLTASGTVMGGRFLVGDRVGVLHGKRALPMEIVGIKVHGMEVDEAHEGYHAGLTLRGAKTELVAAGDWVCRQ